MQTTTTKKRSHIVQIECVHCGKSIVTAVAREDWNEYYSPDNTRYIRDVFPYLSDEEREMMLSNICPECWEDLFAEFEDIGE